MDKSKDLPRSAEPLEWRDQIQIFEKRIQRYMAPFLEDLYEQLNKIDRELVALKEEPTEEKWKQLGNMRSLEHAANFINGVVALLKSFGLFRSVLRLTKPIELIKDACSKLARIFEFAFHERLPLNHELLSLLFTTVDGLKDVGMRLSEQQDLLECALATLLPRWDAVIKEVHVQLTALQLLLATIRQRN